jgi:hypothetical protein
MMFKGKKPRDKKKILDRLKRFANGEDVAAEVLPLSYNMAVLTTDELKKLTLLQAYKQEHGIDLIEPGWKFTSENGELTVDYDEVTAINNKLNSAPRIVSDKQPRWFTKIVDPVTGQDQTGEIDGDHRRPSWYQKATVDGKPVTIEEYDRELAKAKASGQLIWEEVRSHKNEPIKSYPDPEIEGINCVWPDSVVDDFKSVAKPENKCEVNSNDFTKTPTIKKELSRAQLHRLFLESERKRMFEEEKIALEERQRAIFWNKMQSIPPINGNY